MGAGCIGRGGKTTAKVDDAPTREVAVTAKKPDEPVRANSKEPASRSSTESQEPVYESGEAMGHVESMFGNANAPPPKDHAALLSLFVENTEALMNTTNAEVCLFGVTGEEKGVAIVEPEWQEKTLKSIPADSSLVQSRLAGLNVGISCKKARKVEAQPNQDNILFCRTAELTIIAIADGHGEDAGHWTSHWAARFLLRMVLLEIADGDIESMSEQSVMNRIYNRSDEALQARAKADGLDISLSGTTVALCVFDNAARKLYISGAGDSSCILLRPKDASVEVLTTDHKPQDMQENQRIRERGGEVRDGRVWAKGKDYPGLAMSRSLGDLEAHACGVSNVPTVRVVPLDGSSTDGKHLLLCCSDGITDAMPASEAAALVYKEGPERVQQAVSALTDDAKDRWLVQKNGEYTDDISVIAIYI